MNVNNLRLLAACLESGEPVSRELAAAVVPDLWEVVRESNATEELTGKQIAETRAAIVGHLVATHGMTVTDACVDVAEQLGLEVTTVSDNWKRHGKIVRARLSMSRKSK